MIPKTLVTEKALFERLARKLLKEDGVILKRCCADSDDRTVFGAYYTVNRYTHAVESRHISLRDWAIELGVLAATEELEGP